MLDPKALSADGIRDIVQGTTPTDARESGTDAATVKSPTTVSCNVVLQLSLTPQEAKEYALSSTAQRMLWLAIFLGRKIDGEEGSDVELL